MELYTEAYIEFVELCRKFNIYNIYNINMWIYKIMNNGYKWSNTYKVRKVTWVMVLKLSKKVYFLQFCVDSSKKSKSAKTIYI